MSRARRRRELDLCGWHRTAVFCLLCGYVCVLYLYVEREKEMKRESSLLLLRLGNLFLDSAIWNVKRGIPSSTRTRRPSLRFYIVFFINLKLTLHPLNYCVFGILLFLQSFIYLFILVVNMVPLTFFFVESPPYFSVF